MLAEIGPFAELGTPLRIGLALVLLASAHLVVYLVRRAGHQMLSAEGLQRWSKLRTIAGLVTSIAIFTLYFGTIGLILGEFGVSLTAYFASATIIGLAIGFGSQGVVQDVVTGLTVILSDLFHVGDLVEISGQTGVVQNIGMRFTTLLNPLGASVYIPNRTLTNVIIYPRGYVRCFADITVSAEPDLQQQMLARVDEITRGFVEQYRGILRAEPEIEPVAATPSGRAFVRIKFRIWPGRNPPIDGIYKNEVVQALKALDSGYADWMVSVNNEISERPTAIRPFRSRWPRPGGAGSRPR